jgi:hypothetical protein
LLNKPPKPITILIILLLIFSLTGTALAGNFSILLDGEVQDNEVDISIFPSKIYGDVLISPLPPDTLLYPSSDFGFRISRDCTEQKIDYDKIKLFINNDEYTDYTITSRGDPQDPSFFIINLLDPMPQGASIRLFFTRKAITGKINGQLVYSKEAEYTFKIINEGPKVQETDYFEGISQHGVIFIFDRDIELSDAEKIVITINGVPCENQLTIIENKLRVNIPNTALDQSNPYNSVLKIILQEGSVKGFIGEYVWEKIINPIDIEELNITQSFPTDMQENVAVNRDIIISFDQNDLAVDKSKIKLSSEYGIIDILEVKTESREIFIKHDSLPFDSEITLELLEGAVKSPTYPFDVLRVSKPFTLKFTTEKQPLAIVETTPEHNSFANTTLNTMVSIVFDNEIEEIDATKINAYSALNGRIESVSTGGVVEKKLVFGDQGIKNSYIDRENPQKLCIELLPLQKGDGIKVTLDEGAVKGKNGLTNKPYSLQYFLEPAGGIKIHDGYMSQGDIFPVTNLMSYVTWAEKVKLGSNLNYNIYLGLKINANVLEFTTQDSNIVEILKETNSEGTIETFIKGVGLGEATITATHPELGYSCQFIVSVKPATIQVITPPEENIYHNYSSIKVKKGSYRSSWGPDQKPNYPLLYTDFTPDNIWGHGVLDEINAINNEIANTDSIVIPLFTNDLTAGTLEFRNLDRLIYDDPLMDLAGIANIVVQSWRGERVEIKSAEIIKKTEQEYELTIKPKYNLAPGDVIDVVIAPDTFVKRENSITSDAEKNQTHPALHYRLKTTSPVPNHYYRPRAVGLGVTPTTIYPGEEINIELPISGVVEANILVDGKTINVPINPDDPTRIFKTTISPSKGGYVIAKKRTQDGFWITETELLTVVGTGFNHVEEIATYPLTTTPIGMTGNTVAIINGIEGPPGLTFEARYGRVLDQNYNGKYTIIYQSPSNIEGKTCDYITPFITGTPLSGTLEIDLEFQGDSVLTTALAPSSVFTGDVENRLSLKAEMGIGPIANTSIISAAADTGKITLLDAKTDNAGMIRFNYQAPFCVGYDKWTFKLEKGKTINHGTWVQGEGELSIYPKESSISEGASVPIIAELRSRTAGIDVMLETDSGTFENGQNSIVIQTDSNGRGEALLKTEAKQQTCRLLSLLGNNDTINITGKINIPTAAGGLFPVSANTVLGLVKVLPPGGATQLTVTPATATINVGETQQYTATLHYADGTTKDVTSVANWTVSDASIANITSGLATGNSAGMITVTAMDSGKSGTATLNVVAPPPPVIPPGGGGSTVTVTKLTVSPETATINVGDTQQYIATLHYSNGTTKDVTNSAAWTISDGDMADISSGLATGKTGGTTIVTATDSGKTGTATLSVVEPPPVVDDDVITGTVYGFVYRKNNDSSVSDQEGFKPVENVRIELHSDPRVTFTDAQGYYEFKDVPLGAHTVSVMDDNYKEIGRVDVILRLVGGEVVLQNTTATSLTLDNKENTFQADFLVTPIVGEFPSPVLPEPTPTPQVINPEPTPESTLGPEPEPESEPDLDPTPELEPEPTLPEKSKVPLWPLPFFLLPLLTVSVSVEKTGPGTAVIHRKRIGPRKLKVVVIKETENGETREEILLGRTDRIETAIERRTRIKVKWFLNSSAKRSVSNE